MCKARFGSQEVILTGFEQKKLKKKTWLSYVNFHQVKALVKSHSCWDSVVVLAYFVVLQALKVLHHHGLHNLDVGDVADLEDNVGVDLIPGCQKAFNFSLLCTKSSHARQDDGVVVVVEAVEDPLVPALRLGDDPDLRAQIVVVDPLVNQKMPRSRQEALVWDSCVLHVALV